MLEVDLHIFGLGTAGLPVHFLCLWVFVERRLQKGLLEGQHPRFLQALVARMA